MLLQTGPVRLALLNVDGSKLKTLILPPPASGFPDIQWDEKGSTKDLVDGSPRTRMLGFVPVLTLSWPIYDDTRATGTADGQTPSLEALLVLLSGSTGTIRVSPGLAAGGFTADRISLTGIQQTSGFYTGLHAVFTGRNVRPTRDLEVF